MAVQDYYKLSYIESSGNQYISTSIAPNIIGRIRTEVKFKSTSRQFILASWNNSYNAYMVQIGYNKDLGYWTHGISPSAYTDSTIINTSNYYAYDLNLNAGNLKINGSTVLSTSGYASSSRALYIFASNDSADGAYLKASAYLKYLEIYNKSGVLAHNFIPAERKSDGVLGLYNTVNNTFYTNAGSGTFSKGSYIPYALTLNASTGGSVSGGGTINASADGKSYYTAVATPSTNWAFGGWYSDSSYQTLVSSSASYSSSMSANTTLYAKFVPAFTITLSYDSNLGSASYQWTSVSEITLTATPNANDYFMGWYYNSVKLSDDNPYVYEPSGSMTIEARFIEIFALTTATDGNGAISYTRGVDPNDVTFTVIPNANYHFVKYTVNGSDYSTTPLTLHLTVATTITAYFEEDTVHHITATTNIGYNSVFISANDVYYGTHVILWARPYPNYNFVRWDDGNTDNPRTITVTANVTMVAIFQREFDTNGIYQYRCYVKDQMDLTEKPKAFMRVDTFNIKNDLMTTANSTITVLDSFSNVNNGDVLVLYDPMGTTLYQGVIKSIEDNKIVCSQMQSFYSGIWIYNIYPSATLEEELAYLLGQYAQGKMYGSTYTDPLVAQRLGGITIDYTASTSVNLPADLDSDGNENLTETDMEKFIYEMYEKYGIIFDFEINFSGTNYVHIKVPTYTSVKVGNNMYAIKNMKPVTSIEETNRLIIFASDKTYRTTYVATATSIEEEPSTTTNRFDLTNTKIVYSDDAVADLIAANLPDQMYNHKLDFTLIIKNFIYQFGDFNLGGQLDIYYYDEYYNSVLTGYEISKSSNMNITEVKMVCGKVRSKLTQKLTLGRL